MFIFYLSTAAFDAYVGLFAYIVQVFTLPLRQLVAQYLPNHVRIVLIVFFDELVGYFARYLIEQLLFETNRGVQELLEFIEYAIVVDDVAHYDILFGLASNRVFFHDMLFAFVDLKKITRCESTREFEGFYSLFADTYWNIHLPKGYICQSRLLNYCLRIRSSFP